MIDIIPRTADNDRNYTLRQGDDINLECSATEFARILVTHIDTNGNSRIVADNGTYRYTCGQVYMTEWYFLFFRRRYIQF